MSGFDLGATLLSVVKHVLQAADGSNSKCQQVQPVQEPPQYVLTGLPVAIDTLILTKIFLNGDLNRNQVESLLSLFADLDGYLHQFITMLTSIKQKLPANGVEDTNKQERRQMVGQLRTLIDKWSARRQGGLLKTYELSSVMGPVVTGAMGTMGPVGTVGSSSLLTCTLEGEKIPCPI